MEYYNISMMFLFISYVIIRTDKYVDKKYHKPRGIIVYSLVILAVFVFSAQFFIEMPKRGE